MKKERIVLDILEIAVTIVVIEEFRSIKRMMKETHENVLDLAENMDDLRFRRF